MQDTPYAVSRQEASWAGNAAVTRGGEGRGTAFAELRGLPKPCHGIPGEPMGQRYSSEREGGSQHSLSAKTSRDRMCVRISPLTVRLVRPARSNWVVGPEGRAARNVPLKAEFVLLVDLVIELAFTKRCRFGLS